VTPDLLDRLAGVRVLKDARDWPRSSDHVPLAVTLRLG
jgi:exodeoxyribonuclease-3